MKLVMDRGDIQRAVKRIAHEIFERNRQFGDITVIGVHSRGVPLSQRIAGELAQIGAAPAVGALDIGLYRDDLASRPAPVLARTELPADMDDSTVVLVDDVLFTGRTVRASLDALADLGRPGRVQLAVLIDRGHRELPVRADYVGQNLPTSADQRVTVKVDEVDGADGVWIEEGTG